MRKQYISIKPVCHIYMLQIFVEIIFPNEKGFVIIEYFVNIDENFDKKPF
jgi:hypothetical protein